MISIGPTHVYLATPPTCPTHGQMHYSAQGHWTCAGYDGEGCPYTALAEWQYIGTTADTTRTAP